MRARPFGAPRLRVGCVALLVAAAGAATTPVPARAAESKEAEPEAFARIVVDSAELRSGPGVSYRVIYVAHRGETLAIDGRPSKGFWLRVLLSDGRIAYVLGDEVQPFAVTPGEPEAPTRPGLFAPPPLLGSRGGLALASGLLNIPASTGGMQQLGYVEARPSVLLHETFALEAFVGDGLTSDGAKLLYGGGMAVYLAPRWVVCPFVGIFAGGASVSNPDSFIRKHDDFYLARAGGGVLFALRNRILVRLEATDLSLFTPETYENAQTYSAGLGVYF